MLSFSTETLPMSGMAILAEAVEHKQRVNPRPLVDEFSPVNSSVMVSDETPPTEAPPILPIPTAPAAPTASVVQAVDVLPAPPGFSVPAESLNLPASPVRAVPTVTFPAPLRSLRSRLMTGSEGSKVSGGPDPSLGEWEIDEETGVRRRLDFEEASFNSLVTPPVSTWTEYVLEEAEVSGSEEDASQGGSSSSEDDYDYNDSFINDEGDDSAASSDIIEMCF